MSTTTTTTPTRTELVDLAVRCCQIMADGDLDAFRAIVHPEAVNREAQSEPPAARGRGPEAFYATALWLRTAFSDLAFTIDEVLVDADLTAVYCTMSGRHTGDFVIWNPEGEVERAFPPTGRSFAVQHAHFIRVREGLAVEHWRSATTRAWRCSSDGCRPGPRSSSGARSRPGTPASRAAEPAPETGSDTDACRVQLGLGQTQAGADRGEHPTGHGRDTREQAGELLP
jgi:ketosteroid isomerase-like protein